MNIDIEFIPTWNFNFKDLPIKMKGTRIYITGNASGYSANMYNNMHDRNNKITLSFKDVEGIDRVHIDHFKTQEMKDIGIEQIAWSGCLWSDYDEQVLLKDVEEKLKELL